MQFLLLQELELLLELLLEQKQLLELEQMLIGISAQAAHLVLTDRGTVTMMPNVPKAMSVETITAEINGISLAYKSIGMEEDPAVLMVMGLLASHKVWGETIVNELVNSGYRVILFDNRDTGDSEKLDRLGKPNLYWKYFLVTL